MECIQQGSFPPPLVGGKGFSVSPPDPSRVGGKYKFPPQTPPEWGEIDLENLIQKGLFTRAPQAKFLGDWWGGISAPQAKIWTILNL